MRPTIVLFVLALLAAALPDCRTKPQGATPAPIDLVLTSTAFADGDEMPEVYTCTGGGISPPLSWSGVPEGTRSLTLILERNADATVDDIGTAGDVHWIVYDLPPDLTEIPEGYRLHDPIDGSYRGTNDFGVIGYDGPCPPKGEVSLYTFHLYAVSDLLKIGPGAPVRDVLGAIDSRVLAHGRLTLRYGYDTF